MYTDTDLYTTEIDMDILHEFGKKKTVSCFLLLKKKKYNELCNFKCNGGNTIPEVEINGKWKVGELSRHKIHNRIFSERNIGAIHLFP